ncbi:type VI secretion IcmF C-terminal domain-containing protein [Pseudovibrio denitrificans]|uniref:type VI secretion IcmF C-terminal domain-containing protein n=1 Tax=Pseudovibrio denitrificans TaxID=258256 RepID=UPI001AD8A921|nr:type VI secretion IcmF C-terminal domain-containing protein [Pseudovibrio denitrificans]
MDGTTVSYAHGPSRPVELSWPGDGVPSASLAFFPEVAGEANSINLSGPWSLFRLLEKARVTKTEIPDQYKVRFSLGNRFATFNLIANSVNNPFSARLLQNFTCPKELDA